MYLAMSGCLCLFCWLGNELSEQVRVTYYFALTYVGLYSVNWTKWYNTFDCFNSVILSTGRKCEACSLRLRLGRNSCPIPALSGLHHRHSQQGVHTDSWQICTGVQLYHDERKDLAMLARTASFFRFLHHNDTPLSVGLLWTRDRPVLKTFTWQHTTVTT
jgi:hypothetical protein